MEHCIVVTKEFDRVIDKTYDILEEAQKKITKPKYDSERLNAKIIAIPEIKAGLVLYRKGAYYGTIVKECQSIWLLDNVNIPNNIYTPARKKFKNTKEDTLVKWFINEELDDGIEEFDQRFVNNYYVDDGHEEIEYTTEEDIY